MVQTQVTWHNIDSIKPGVTILYDGRFGKLIEDTRYTGGVRVGGMSLHYILTEYNNVFFVE